MIALFCWVLGVTILVVGSDSVISVAAADHLRSTGVPTTTNRSGSSSRISTIRALVERILPCSSELKDIESEFESRQAVSRHRSDPTERNIFHHHKQTTTPPSELPSTLPSIIYDDNNDNLGTIPSFSPTSVPTNTIHPSVSISPSRTNVPDVPTIPPSFVPSLEPSLVPTTTFVPTLIDDDLNSTNTPTLIDVDFNNTYEPSFIDDDFNSTGNSTIDPIGTLVPTYSMNDSSIEDFLIQTLSDDGAIDSIGSPQYKAISALLNSSSELNTNDPNDQIEILQRYALNTLYFSTNGENWKVNDLWTSASNPCGTKNNETNNDTTKGDAWYGVLCDSNLEVIEKLSLESNDLRGELPSEIRGLSNLVSLDISDNQVSGLLSDAIGELKDLSVLDIGSNFFAGTIPQTIGNITSLVNLDTSFNFLSGTLGTELGQLTRLLSLSVDSNYLGGSIPSELFGITNLSKCYCI